MSCVLLFYLFVVTVIVALFSCFVDSRFVISCDETKVKPVLVMLRSVMMFLCISVIYVCKKQKCA